MGRFSRNKGRRGEQQLVLFLAKMGYKAERVLNQAHTSGLYDVLAKKDGKEYSFELKSYKDAFKSIYDLYYRSGVAPQPLCCHLGDGVGVAITTDFETLARGALDLRFVNPLDAFERRVYRRLKTMNKLRGSADFLVLKDNNKARLFLKYWS